MQASSTLGFLSIAFIPIPFVLYKVRPIHAMFLVSASDKGLVWSNSSSESQQVRSKRFIDDLILSHWLLWAGQWRLAHVGDEILLPSNNGGRVWEAIGDVVLCWNIIPGTEKAKVKNAER